ncbi:hypothetical protein [Noviherbaspirillum suwonense]|uniref:hypothetical protein n=1 Tax=Noviherbaspirillum suwonense TaxID=1224511 RepID=UPI0024B725A0|nr:hypothetical protein [Noviherbaspirillum suwonense]
MDFPPFQTAPSNRVVVTLNGAPSPFPDNFSTQSVAVNNSPAVNIIAFIIAVDRIPMPPMLTLAQEAELASLFSRSRIRCN